MKIVVYISILFSCILFSCSKQESVPLQSASADGNITITISGSRQGVLDAWMLEVQVNHKGTVDKVYQEFYADEVTEKNVRFEWRSTQECIIHLTQRDGVKIDIPVQIHK